MAVHIGRLWIRIVDPVTQQFIREHDVTGKGQRRIVDAYLPKQTPIKVEQLAARVAGAGPGCKAFADRLVEERGSLALRALYGILDLLRRYDAAAVDGACAFAASSGIASSFYAPISRITRRRCVYAKSIALSRRLRRTPTTSPH